MWNMKSFVHRAQQKTWQGGKQNFSTSWRIKRPAQHHVGSQQQSGNQTNSLVVIQTRGWPKARHIKLHHPSDWIHFTEGATFQQKMWSSELKQCLKPEGERNVLDILKFLGLGIFKMKCFWMSLGKDSSAVFVCNSGVLTYYYMEWKESNQRQRKANT